MSFTQYLQTKKYNVLNNPKNIINYKFEVFGRAWNVGYYNMKLWRMKKNLVSKPL